MRNLKFILSILFLLVVSISTHAQSGVVGGGQTNVSGGGGGAGTNASTSTVIDAANPTYGMKWDGVQVSDATFTSGSPNVSSTAAATFTQADVGKTFYGYPTCGVDGVANGQSSLFGANTTILTVTNSHNIVVSSNS